MCRCERRRRQSHRHVPRQTRSMLAEVQCGTIDASTHFISLQTLQVTTVQQRRARRYEDATADKLRLREAGRGPAELTRAQ